MPARPGCPTPRTHRTPCAVRSAFRIEEKQPLHKIWTLSPLRMCAADSLVRLENGPASRSTREEEPVKHFRSRGGGESMAGQEREQENAMPSDHENTSSICQNRFSVAMIPVICTRPRPFEPGRADPSRLRLPTRRWGEIGRNLPPGRIGSSHAARPWVPAFGLGARNRLFSPCSKRTGLTLAR